MYNQKCNEISNSCHERQIPTLIFAVLTQIDCIY